MFGGGPRRWINTPSSVLPLHKRGAGQPPRVLHTPAVTQRNFPQVGRTRQQHRARQLAAASGEPQPHGPRPVCFLLLQIQCWHLFTVAQPRPAGPHGLHNRNSGCGCVSHRRPGPPCSPSFLRTPPTPPSLPAGPRPGDAHAIGGCGPGRASPREPRHPTAMCPRPRGRAGTDARPLPCSQFFPPNRSGHSHTYVFHLLTHVPPF